MISDIRSTLILLRTQHLNSSIHERRQHMWKRIIHRVRRLDEQLQDWGLGIKTTEWHTQFDPARPDFRGYSPTSYRDWHTIRRHIDAPARSTFIDYGCGLGRVTILAFRLRRFARIIGVEFDQSLVTRARENVLNAGAASAVSIACVDATTFEVPDDAAVLYFYNPFCGSVLAGVIERCRDSLRKNPRSIRLICNLPHESAFEPEISAVEWLDLIARVDLADQRKCLIFGPR
jgi:SAM-dependent methyltransferase